MTNAWREQMFLPERGACLVREPRHMLSICVCGLAEGEPQARCYVNALSGQGGRDEDQKHADSGVLCCHLSILHTSSRPSASWKINYGRSRTATAPLSISQTRWGLVNHCILFSPSREKIKNKIKYSPSSTGAEIWLRSFLVVNLFKKAKWKHVDVIVVDMNLQTL